MYLMFCILHLFIFHGANRIDGGAPQGGLSCPSDNSPSEGLPPYGSGYTCFVGWAALGPPFVNSFADV